ncbi:hypothetical protein BH11PSE13_BH11PSE13_16860 [soil metagenome]
MNKHIHRVIFSKARGQFVAVSETATSTTRGASGSTEGGGIVRIAAIALAVGLLCSGAMAAPFGGQVMNGGATINGGGNLTTINQTTIITQATNATNDVVLLSNVNVNAGQAYDGYIDAKGGGIRNGNNVLTSASRFDLIAGNNSAVNTNANVLSVASTGAVTTLVVNEKDNVTVIDGNPAGAGSIEINARGEINLPTNWTRSSGASLPELPLPSAESSHRH